MLRAITLKEVLNCETLLCQILRVPINLLFEFPERLCKTIDHQLVEEEEAHARGDEKQRLRAFQQDRGLLA